MKYQRQCCEAFVESPSHLISFQNVDVTSISLILAGLARCGAFGCFDEFNRLQEATLSVLSMIIQPIQMAIQQKSDTVTIFDQKVCCFH